MKSILGAPQRASVSFAIALFGREHPLTNTARLNVFRGFKLHKSGLIPCQAPIIACTLFGYRSKSRFTICLLSINLISNLRWL